MGGERFLPWSGTAVGTTGDDPELDTLLIRMHTESACRTGGALALRPRDLNQDQCLILRYRNGTPITDRRYNHTPDGKWVDLP